MKKYLKKLHSVILFILFLLFNTTLSFSQEKIDRPVYQLENENLQTIPHSYFQYLEGVDHTIPIKELKSGKWTNNMKTPQSFYDGYWIKIAVYNSTKNEVMGIHHNFNFEKKLIYENKLGLKIFNFLDSEQKDYKYKDENRIWFDYKIQMPIGEVTEIYSYFRSQPLDRVNSRKGGLDKISIGTWKEIEFAENFRTLRYLITIPVFLFFAIYFLMFYLVSRDKNYLWISILLFVFSFQGVAFSSSSYFGYRFNYMYGPMGLALVSAVVIQFFRNLLLLNQKYQKLDIIFLWTIRAYLFLVIIYFFDSLQYPGGEIYKNLIKYPYPKYGVGTIPIFIASIPVVIASLTSVVISGIMWRNGDKASGYLIISFLIPVVGALSQLPRFLAPDIFNESYVIERFVVSIPGFALLFIPATIGLALAQRSNDTKQVFLDKQIELNESLEKRVQQRTYELTKANQTITESINSAKAIQNAILPEIDAKVCGFKEFEYVWEPRDIVGGDFYWIGQKEDWTSLIVADCTGHGIPGAFMTLVSSTLLGRISYLKDLSKPDQILSHLDELLEETLRYKEGGDTSFGLDCGIICFSQKHNLLRYAGAKTNLYQKIDEEVIEIKGDKKSLGYEMKEHPIEFKVTELDTSQHSSFFIFSDGITDQVGGKKKLMYGKKRVIAHIKEAVDVQSAVSNIVADINQYQAGHKRRDDLTLFGFAV